ncbi:hypothetical protein N7447_006601 [Penicillium robsamsonii]|uniref:uncharacterized protein n=1 Tax=Penicillium robsamsonii TaxID=1792511 RepID=UPI002546E746|nr:uncharacterized protein N7447_006601 [Penicillium robsamsonii]KAJ5824261.1 hypothetical protein N7447_006601 [Penicillium robsamsonii]
MSPTGNNGRYQRGKHSRKVKPRKSTIKDNQDPNEEIMTPTKATPLRRYTIVRAILARNGTSTINNPTINKIPTNASCLPIRVMDQH